MERDPVAEVYPFARHTRLDGQAVTIRYGGHPTDIGVASGPIRMDAPFLGESVHIVYADGKERGAELPREWREWTDVELIEKLPMCNLLGFSK